MVLTQITTDKLVAMIRAKSKAHAISYIKKTIAGGINLIEVTMTTPGALEILQELRQKYEDMPEVVFGAGAVLDAITARLAILAGAKFVVSPYLDEETVKMCHRYQIPVLPGVMNIQEAVRAMELGCDLVQLFPGQLVGPHMIKAFKGPLPHLQIMATGGVNLENVHDWLRNGAVAVGIGSDLTEEAERTYNLELVYEKARAYRSQLEIFPLMSE